VLGASVIQQVLLRAGLVDELHVEMMPVLLGAGLRLFDGPGLESVTLDKIGVREVGAMTELRFRVANSMLGGHLRHHPAPRLRSPARCRPANRRHTGPIRPSQTRPGSKIAR
jgi:RibD C-terminal domain